MNLFKFKALSNLFKKNELTVHEDRFIQIDHSIIKEFNTALSTVLQVFYYQSNDNQALADFYYRYHTSFEKYQTFIQQPQKSDNYSCCQTILKEFLPLTEEEREPGQNQETLLTLKNLIVREKLLNTEELVYLFYSQLNRNFNQTNQSYVENTLISIFSDNLFVQPAHLLRVIAKREGLDNHYLDNVADNDSIHSLSLKVNDIVARQNTYELKHQLDTVLPEKDNILIKRKSKI